MKIMYRTPIAAALFLGLLFVTADAFAQQTRAAQWAALQAEKAKDLHPREPTKAEKILERMERNFAGTSQGFYPFFGSAFPGGGLAFGGGFRRLVGDNGVFDVHAGYSIRGYRLATTSLLLPSYASGRMRTLIHAKYQFADEVPFFGIGNETDEDAETAFTYTPITFGVGQNVELTDEFHVGGDISYQMFDTEEGKSSRVPSLDEFFPRAQAPGFGLDFEYIVGNVFAEYDWRHEAPGYATSGGLYRVDWTNYAERDEPEGFDFTRFDIVLIQHIPILRGNQALSFRGLASITDTKGDDRIPFFLLPKLGGGSELRGFKDFRFRDNHRLLITGEYRWMPSKFMDMVLFYEVGKVASDRDDLDFEDLHNSYGIGARFHGPGLTALRIELARSVEGMRIIFSGGAAF